MSLGNCTREGIVAMPIVTMALPASMAVSALITKAFPLPTTEIGIMASMPFIGNFLQIFVSPALMRWRPAKTVTVSAAVLHLLSWIALGFLLPFIPRDSPAAAGPWLLGWFLVSSCLGAVAGISWSTWIDEWMPVRLRGKFFGRRNQLTQFSTVVFLTLSGWVLYAWGYSVAAFQAVIFGSCFLRIFSLRWQWLSPTRPHHPAPAEAGTVGSQLDILLGAPAFLVFVLFGAVWSWDKV